MLIIVILLVSSCSRPVEKINYVNDKVVKDTNISNNLNKDNVDSNINIQAENKTEDTNINDEDINSDINAEDVELDDISDLFEDF